MKSTRPFPFSRLTNLPHFDVCCTLDLTKRAPPSCDTRSVTDLHYHRHVLTQATDAGRESYLEIASVLAEINISAIHIPISGWAGRSKAEIESRTNDGGGGGGDQDAAHSRASQLAYFGVVRSLLRNASLTGMRVFRQYSLSF